MGLQAQTPAPKPGPEHQKLNIRPILNGFFVEFRMSDKGPAGPGEYVEVDGYDALNKKYTWEGFGSDGSVQSVSYTIDGTPVFYSGVLLLKDKAYKIRGTAIFGADFATWTKKREFSEDGQTWMPNLQSKATKSTKR
jgi:hypothetical protein